MFDISVVTLGLGRVDRVVIKGKLGSYNEDKIFRMSAATGALVECH